MSNIAGTTGTFILSSSTGGFVISSSTGATGTTPLITSIVMQVVTNIKNKQINLDNIAEYLIETMQIVANGNPSMSSSQQSDLIIAVLTAILQATTGLNPIEVSALSEVIQLALPGFIAIIQKVGAGTIILGGRN